MTERGYRTAKAMAEDPRTPEHERDTAARRVREHEAEQRAAGAAQGAADRVVIEGFFAKVGPVEAGPDAVNFWLRYFHGDRGVEP